MKRRSTKSAKREETLLDVIEVECGGARGKRIEIARRGLPELPTNATIDARKRDAAQYRAGVALLWDRNRILEETGWSFQRLRGVERFVQDEDKRTTDRLDPRTIFAEYRVQQLQAAAELADFAEVFSRTGNTTSLVAAIKARSDVLDRIVKTGQELGVIKRAAREVRVDGQIDFKSMSVRELRIHLQREVTEMRELLRPPEEIGGVATAVLSRVLGKPRKLEAPKEEVKESQRKVKRLKSG